MTEILLIINGHNTSKLNREVSAQKISTGEVVQMLGVADPSLLTYRI